MFRNEFCRLTFNMVLHTTDPVACHEFQIWNCSLEDRILPLLVDLERDYVKWMRGELHMDLKNPYSPAIRTADDLPEHEQSSSGFPRVR